MANITAAIKKAPSNQNFQSPIITDSYFWDPVGGRGAGGTATSTAATHQIIAIPSGYALTGGRFVVTQAFVGSSSTVQFGAAAELTGLIAEADLTIGLVVPFVLHAYVNQDGSNDLHDELTWAGGVGDNYVDGTVITAQTIDAIIGTNTLTAGQGFFLVDWVKIDELQATVG